MERIYAKFLLYKHGFTCGEEYQRLLDETFLKDEGSEFLQELEWCSSSIDKTNDSFNHYWTYENFINKEIFSKFLILYLKDIYYSNSLNIADFGKSCYFLWKDLPNTIYKEKPLWILSYADDPLSWGDENEARRIYEELFSYYE